MVAVVDAPRAGGGRASVVAGRSPGGIGGRDSYRVRRARFASIVWDRDWVRCLGVTV